MKNYILQIIIFSISTQIYAVTETQVAAQIKQANQLISDMSAYASHMSGASTQARVSLSSGTVGVINARNISSPLPTEIGSMIETLPQHENNNISMSKREAIARARAAARRTVIQEMRNKQIKEQESGASNSILLLIIISALFV